MLPLAVQPAAYRSHAVLKQFLMLDLRHLLGLLKLKWTHVYLHNNGGSGLQLSRTPCHKGVPFFISRKIDDNLPSRWEIRFNTAHKLERQHFSAST